MIKVHRILGIVLCCAGCLCACQNVPKYKKSSGHFAEWSTYEGKNFSPRDGKVAAVDLTAQTITILRGDSSKIYPVSPTTRIMHEGTDITLAQLPLGRDIKYTLSQDGVRLLTVWYGEHAITNTRRVPQRRADLF